MKKIVALFLALAMLFGCVFALSACGNGSDTTTDGTKGGEVVTPEFDETKPYGDYTPDHITEEKYFKVKDKDDGTVIVSGVYADVPDTTIVVPARIGGKLVVEIGEAAFAKASMVGVVIPASVTTIGEGAFANCAKLVDVYLPDSITVINKSAFRGCENLRSIDFLPASITKINERVFEECTLLANIKIPANITEIANYAFNGCKQISQATIGAQVTSIGNSAFGGCKRLRKIRIIEGSAADTWFKALVEKGTFKAEYAVYETAE